MVDYVDLDYTPSKNDLIAMYYVEKAPDCKDIAHCAMEIAKESSIGTWTDIVTMSKDIAERLRPSTYYINEEDHIIKIAYSDELFEAGNLSQILSAIAGNIYGMKTLKYLRLLKNALTFFFKKQVLLKTRLNRHFLSWYNCLIFSRLRM